jgi:hypothetical protein
MENDDVRSRLDNLSNFVDNIDSKVLDLEDDLRNLEK